MELEFKSFALGSGLKALSATLMLWGFGVFRVLDLNFEEFSLSEAETTNLPQTSVSPTC